MNKPDFIVNDLGSFPVAHNLEPNVLALFERILYDFADACLYVENESYQGGFWRECDFMLDNEQGFFWFLNDCEVVGFKHPFTNEVSLINSSLAGAALTLYAFSVMLENIKDKEIFLKIETYYYLLKDFGIRKWNSKFFDLVD